MIKKLIVFTAVFAISGCSAFAAQPSDKAFRNSVVKVFVFYNEPDFFKPWQTQGTQQVSGSGCIIEGRRILTNAHVLSHHVFVQVKKEGDPKKYTASVDVIGHDSDLAILSVEDPHFFEGTEPIPMGDLPRLKDKVTVIGFPIGGEQLSVTEGVVSRIEITAYVHGYRGLIAVQIDAAINAGNSGGPVVQDEKLVGIAFQGLKQGENIGYIIPIPVIEHFFKDLEDGRYDGIPHVGLLGETTESPAIQHLYGLKGVGGVLVTAVLPRSPAEGVLKAGDIIYEMEGVPVDSDATIRFRGDERIGYFYLVHTKQVGDVLDLKVLREGKELPLRLELKPYTELVPRPYHFEAPPYFIQGGLVFTVLSNDLLKGWSEEWGLGPLFSFNYYNLGPGRLRTEGRSEIPVLLNVLPDSINEGYHDLRFHVIDKVNGHKILDFKDLVGELYRSDAEYLVIDTEEFSRIVLDNSEMDEANARILKKYRIPAAYSDDIARWL